MINLIELVETHAGSRVRVTMIDDAQFEGVLYFVELRQSDDTPEAIFLDSIEFGLPLVYVKNIEPIYAN